MKKRLLKNWDDQKATLPGHHFEDGQGLRKTKILSSEETPEVKMKVLPTKGLKRSVVFEQVLCSEQSSPPAKSPPRKRIKTASSRRNLRSTKKSIDSAPGPEYQAAPVVGPEYQSVSDISQGMSSLGCKS